MCWGIRWCTPTRINFQTRYPLWRHKVPLWHKKCQGLITFEENVLRNWKLALRLILCWGIRWCTQTKKHFKTRYHLRRHRVGPKKCQVLITFEEKWLGSCKLTLRLILKWEIRWCTQTKKHFKTRYHLWRHRVPLRPKKYQVLITFEEKGIGCKLTLRLILRWGIPWCTQTKKHFKTRYHLWRHKVPLRHKKCQGFITFEENVLRNWKLALRLIMCWGIRWCTPTRINFQTRYPLWRHKVPLWHKKCQGLITFEENVLRNWKLALRLILCWGIRWCTQTKKHFKTRYLLRRHRVGPKKCQVLITFEEKWLGSCKLTLRLILKWEIRWCTQTKKHFKTRYHLWRHRVPLRPKKYQVLITFEEKGLGSCKLILRLILGWGIRWCTPTHNIFKTRYPLWRHKVPLRHKKCQGLITFQENVLGNWKLALRLILCWGIRWCTQTKKLFKTRYHLWRHRVPLRPKKCQVLITFEEKGLGSCKLTLRLILKWGIRWCTQTKKHFKTRYHLWRHKVPLWPKKCQVLITSDENGLGSCKLTLKQILRWGIRWCTQTNNILKTRYHLWHHKVLLLAKKCQVLITSEENGLGSCKLAVRKILGREFHGARERRNFSKPGATCDVTGFPWGPKSAKC